MSILLTLVIVTSTAQEPTLNVHEFLALIKTLHNDFESASLIFEGDYYATTPDALRRDSKANVSFQGTYLLRTRKAYAALLDIYRTHSPGPSVRQSYAVIDFKLLKSGGSLARATGGGPGVLSINNSPERFIYTYYFKSLEFAIPERMFYEFLGWETVDGHRCMKVKLGRTPGGKNQNSYYLFWIDVARGGHPLRVESTSAADSKHVVKQIRLAQFTSEDGKLLWFPIRGTTEVLGPPGAKAERDVVYKEDNGVVLGSLKLNVALDDTFFLPHTMKGTKSSASLELERSKGFVAAAASVAKPRSPTDPKSVDNRLEAKISEASRQSSELDASAPKNNAWDGLAVARVFAIFMGIAALTLVGVLKWRNRK